MLPNGQPPQMQQVPKALPPLRPPSFAQPITSQGPLTTQGVNLSRPTIGDGLPPRPPQFAQGPPMGMAGQQVNGMDFNRVNGMPPAMPLRPQGLPQGLSQGPNQGPNQAPPNLPPGSNQGMPQFPPGPNQMPPHGPTHGPNQMPPHGPTQGPPHGTTQGPPQGPTHGPTQGPPHAPTQGPPHGPPHGPTQGPPHGPPQGQSQGPTQGPPQGPPHGPTQGPSQGPPHGPTQGPPHGPTQGPTQGPPHGPTQGPPHGPTQGPTQGPPQLPLAPNQGLSQGPNQGPNQGPPPGLSQGPIQGQPHQQFPPPMHHGPPTPAQNGRNSLLPTPSNYYACPPVSGQHSTPNHSEPPSAKSSRNPSPIPSQRYDYMEGQFSSTASPASPSANQQQQRPPPMAQQMHQQHGMPPIPQHMPQQHMPPQYPPPNQQMAPNQHMAPNQQMAPNQPIPPHQQMTNQQIPPHQQMPPMPPRPTQQYPPQPNAPNSAAGSMGRRYPQVPPAGMPPTGVPPTGVPPTGYPSQPYHQGPPSGVDGISASIGGLSVTQGFSKMWGSESIDLLQHRNILPPDAVETPQVQLQHDHLTGSNCSPDIFRCTLTRLPESNSLLQKSRLPLGILIHPFRDLNHLPVIQCSTIVRCRACRTYINPFVYFVDQRRWKCNLCFRVNELPEEFQYDPVSKTYGDPSRRPEVKASTIEFIAPSEYMLRPPQPAVYLFVLDVSRPAVESGYLKLFCDTLLDNLDKLPGDSRTQIGFVTVDRSVHFYNLSEGLSQPHQMVVGDLDDIFLPCPDSLLVNLQESGELVRDLLTQLPTLFMASHETQSALGAALQAAFKLLAPTGGRVTVMQTVLPTVGPGALKMREDPNQRSGKDAPGGTLTPATDFYKRLALDCSGQQVAVDLFLLNAQYADLASLSCISKFSGGCVYHFPQLQAVHNPVQSMRFEKTLARYLTRKIGFEAVMRIRCSRGLAIHTFHGNFFVRSTDLLSLPNINPDAGFGMQVSIEESLSDLQTVCFQAALLYTSSKGERRIRVHTLCLPIAATLSEVLSSADQQCIAGLLAKMAVDRSQSSSLLDAREAMMNAAVDSLSAFRLMQSMGQPQGLLAPPSLRLLPLYMLAMLKHVAFRTGACTRADDRVFSMGAMKTMPLHQLIQAVYPDLYPVHNLAAYTTEGKENSSSGETNGDSGANPVAKPPRLQLSSEKVDSTGAYILDSPDSIILYIGKAVLHGFCQSVLGVPHFQAVPDHLLELPEVETAESEQLRAFVEHLQGLKPHPVPFIILRDDSKNRHMFIERLVEDRSEAAFSYYEFLQHLKTQIK